MMHYLPSLQKLVRLLQRVPYLASKNVYRVAAYFVDCPRQEVELFCQAILDAHARIATCAVCFNLTEGAQLCALCSSEKRQRDVICVVESWHDLSAIEKTGEFQGLYHVLGGVLSPLEGIGPHKLRVDPLVLRLKDHIQEVIFALNPTPEGEATMSYIQSKMNGYEGKISKLARGMPVGSSLEFMDRITIGKALSDRKIF